MHRTPITSDIPQDSGDSEISNLPTAPTTEKRSADQKSLILALFDEPVLKPLATLLDRLLLQRPSETLDINSYIEAIRLFVNLTGPDRAKYFGKLTGLHSPSSFLSAWNKEYRIKLQPEIPLCPFSWAYVYSKGGRGLIYTRDAAVTDGFPELLVRPVIIDCGVWRQLILWLAIWYLIGDETFNKVFSCKPREFTLMPDHDGLLRRFYDLPEAGESQPQPNIQISTVYNDVTYPAKHPAGCERLQNVISINDVHFIFNPGGPSILSVAELEQRLRAAYNTPQQPEDRDIIRLYKENPEKVPPGLRKHLSENDQYVDRTLDEDEWGRRKREREAKASKTHYVLNFKRLMSFIQERAA
ncbi:hypothetical protein BGZ63DRAFT_402082 [Mariannaea sp. PMI_226]|nr:hypothetical protein BGZ63DRAFT_402082 [Mariannaea sp. PMI_226]